MKIHSTFEFTESTNGLNLQPVKKVDLVSTGRKYIPFGGLNLFPHLVASINRQGSDNRAIINSKTRSIAGVGITSDDNKLNDLIKESNLHKVTRNRIYDNQSLGNAYYIMVTDKKKSFVKFLDIDVTKVRLGINGDEVLIYNDWTTYNDSKKAVKIPLYPCFDELKSTEDVNIGDTKGLYATCYHQKDYEQEFDNYGVPSWFAGWIQLLTQLYADNYNKEELENMMHITGLIVIPGVNDEPAALKIKENFEKRKVGGEKAGEPLLINQKDAEVGQARTVPTILDLKKKLDGSFAELDKTAYDKLIRIHNWYDVLMGQSTPGQLGGNEQILTTYELALSFVIVPEQNEVIQIYKTILTDFGYNTDTLRFVNKSPVSKGGIDIAEWQLLELKGLPFDEKINNKMINLTIEQFNILFNGTNNSDGSN
uniref:Portal protein n=1 Tax=uncultured marine virus TaxID=186617 RepID=A0A0F7L4S1_9VIRU|nr:hypothetical protein [uncultured marine virus]